MSPRRMIAVLEDDARRTAAMRAVLAEGWPAYRHEFLPDALAMIAFLRVELASVRVLSLDHDLGPVTDPGGLNPGTGMDVVRYLARQAPLFPVILHSSHRAAVLAMQEELEHAGWTVRTVSPIFDLEWITTDWRAELSRLLAG